MSESKMTFNCNNFNRKKGPPEYRILNGDLKYFYESGDLYDLILHSIDGQTFKAHILILIAASAPFKKLLLHFPSNFEVTHILLDLKGRVLKTILSYIYSGDCDLTGDIIEETLAAAHKWEIIGLVTLCSQFLVERMTPDNCITIYKVASEYFCSNQKKTVWRFLTSHFNEIYQVNNEFPLLKIRTLHNLLMDDYLNVRDEITVVEALNKWIIYDLEERKKHAADLLQCVRFGFLPEQYFNESVKNLPYLNDECVEMLRGTETAMVNIRMRTCAMEYNMIFFRPRVPYEMLFVIHGWSDYTPTNIIECYDVRSKRWSIADKDGAPRAYHGTAVLNNLIYIIGGYNKDEIFRTVYCFDPETKLWSNKRNMSSLRCYTAVCTLGGEIYVLGGYDGRIRLRSAEKYNPTTGEWTGIPPMIYARSDAGAASLYNKIYVVGGVNDAGVQNTVEQYDPVSSCWTLITAMSFPRSGVSVVTYNNCIYALGGYDGNDRLRSCEKLDPRVHISWVKVPDMLRKKSNFGAAVIDGSIYSIGGFDGTTTVTCCERYNDELQRWVQVPPIRLKRSALSTGVCSGLINVAEYTSHSTTKQDFHIQCAGDRMFLPY